MGIKNCLALFAVVMAALVGLSVEALAQAASSAPAASATPPAAAKPDTSPSAAKAFQNGVGMTLVPVPAGEFLMGSTEPQEVPNFSAKTGWWKLIEGPQHKVTLTKSFYLGATEVTRGQWKAVMGACPGPPADDDTLPVDWVSWDDARVFLRKLSEKEGRTYRLPTEAEWEYACRAGSTTRYCYGDEDEKLDEYAWHAKAAPKEFKLHPVGQKKPNAWGLYDVHGNAWEWCQDRFAGSKAPYEAGPQVDPIGAVKDWGDRLMRGGARFYNKATMGTSTCRGAYEGDYRIAEVGLRVALTSAEVVRPEPAKSPAAPAAPTWAQKVPTPEEQARLEKLGAIRNGVGMVMMPIPAGEFTMGSDETKYEQPPHQVKITKPFLMGATEVTQAQWKAVMGDNPSLLPGDDLPVENIVWEECQAFVKKLSEKEGKSYRLPTEAEWEYACRAGSTTRFFFGDDITKLGDYAWYGLNSAMQTHPVAQKQPNAWGLYDMYGNVWEWCQDLIAMPYAGEAQVDPTGPVKGSQRVFRGGAWYDEGYRCRSAFRNSRNPNSRNYFGLRVVLVP